MTQNLACQVANCDINVVLYTFISTTGTEISYHVTMLLRLHLHFVILVLLQTDSDGYETEKAGMVRVHQKKR